MKPEAEKLLDLAQKRLDALRALAAAISEAQMALTNLDLEVIEENIERQKSLCSAISDLDSEIMCLRRLLNGKMDTASANRWSEFLRQMQTAGIEVRRQNQVQAGLWRALRRTLQAIQLCLSSQDLGLYRPPRAPQNFLFAEGRAR
jgi:flagellar biosynthesis/type III secretory pathway chaperone